ncbi:MAG: hypothetical protein HGA24_03005 [Candidatus Aminicenantes bacterium]|nr:hypothetical protein [Candidatus Aminicenantes bacterium]
MKRQRTLLILGLTAVVALAFVAVQARADVYMKQKTHTGAFTVMGQSQPEKDEIMVFWLGAGKARTDTEGKSMLFFSDKKVLIGIDHAEKTYSEIPMDFDKMFEEAAEGETEEEKAEAKKMAQMMKGMAQGMMGSMKVSVTETGETKKIGSWNCRKYLIDMDMGMMKAKSESWASEDLKVDYNVYFTMANAMMANMPGFDKLVQEMKKVKGVIVYQTSTSKVMGQDMTSTTEVLEYSDKSAPAGTYDIPAGYKKVKASRGM